MSFNPINFTWLFVWLCKKRGIVIALLLLLCHSVFAASAPRSVTLSLEDAILLAVRENPNVQSSQLKHVTQKFSLWVQQWQFLPHYSLQASASTGQTTTWDGPTNNNNFDVKPGVSLLTPYGTKLAINATNTRTKHYNPGVNFEITQPLMRGFGRPVVEAALKNAIDSEKISRLTIERTLRTTVTEVINAYLDLMNAQQRIKINENALTRAQQSVKQTKIFIKAGRKAGTELVTVEADVARAQSNLENEKNSLDNARSALLTAIGIDPNAEAEFIPLDIKALLKKYHLPSLEETKKLTLANDTNYQTSIITLYGNTTRALMTAENNTLPILNFKANVGTGNASGGGHNSGWNSLWNGSRRTNSVGFTLEIPIDDQLSKQALLNAKIGVKEAEIALKQDKWRKETSAINGWNLVKSKERALKFAISAEELQEKTYNLSYQKYLHGLIDSLQLQSAQLQLIETQQNLLAAHASYLKALVDLDSLTGHTLRTWHIGLRL